MQRLANLLNQNWIGVVIGLIGLLSAYVFYRRSQIRRRLAYQRYSFQIISMQAEFPSGLEIFYRGERVSRVINSTVVIWNDGNASIGGEHIIKSDPLRIVLPEGSRVLDLDILRMSREVIAFRAQVSTKDSSNIECTFDFLDPKDGAVISILHTGDAKVSLKGTIRGIPEGAVDLGDYPEPPIWKLAMVAFLSAATLAIVLIALTEKLIGSVPWQLLIIFIIICGGIEIILMLRPSQRPKMPRQLSPRW